MNDPEPWVCRCRKCHGVHDAADAVQYVWEFSFGACDVPVVIGPHVRPSGHVFTAIPYWHGAPEVIQGFSRAELYVVSCRPGALTVAGWMREVQGERLAAEAELGSRGPEAEPLTVDEVPALVAGIQDAVALSAGPILRSRPRCTPSSACRCPTTRTGSGSPCEHGHVVQIVSEDRPAQSHTRHWRLE